MFKVVDVSSWRIAEVDEPLGTKEKDWLFNPAGQRWLFKRVRSPVRNDRGEDWAEKVVEQLGLHLGLPVATVELATREGRRGIISRNFVPDEGRLEHGNELLVRVDPDYDRDLTRRNERYTIEAVKLALADATAPDAYVVEGLDAFDLWSGYLLLDAWVAGRDRHHENWAVVAGHQQRRVLAPTFDHGNALGFQEPEERHVTLSNDLGQLERWAARGTSHHFAGQPQLVDLAHAALDLASERARRVWPERLQQVTEEDVAAIIEQVPPPLMSVAARTFCRTLLMTNKRRLCDVD